MTSVNVHFKSKNGCGSSIIVSTQFTAHKTTSQAVTSVQIHLCPHVLALTLFVSACCHVLRPVHSVMTTCRGTQGVTEEHAPSYSGRAVLTISFSSLSYSSSSGVLSSSDLCNALCTETRQGQVTTTSNTGGWTVC